MKKSLVDVAGFRQRYGIKQVDLASFLGITRGFISLIESGKAKLSQKNIDKILAKWGICGLVPCYDRLCQLCSELVLSGELPSWHLETQVLPFQDLLTSEVVTNIKYGKTGITDEIANKIVYAFPRVNKDWLVLGEGDMFYDETQSRLNEIEAKLDLIIEKLNYLIGMCQK